MATKSRPKPSSKPRPSGRGGAVAAQQRNRQRMILAAVVAAALAILGGVGYLAFGQVSAADEAAAKAGFSAEKESFDLPGLLDDNHVRLADHRGRPVVVNFFASWCVYCNQELPGFVEVAKATQGQVDFIGVQSNDTGDGVAMAKRFDLAGAGFALAKDIGPHPASQLWETFGGQGLPVTVFYDAEGKWRYTSGGMLTQEMLTDEITKRFDIEVKATDASGLQAPVIPLIPKGANELLQGKGGSGPFTAVDARPAPAFAAGHLEGAINIDASGDLPAALGKLSKDGNYIVYGQTGTDADPLTAAMHAAGFKHVYVIEGGLKAWTEAGGPTTP